MQPEMDEMYAAEAKQIVATMKPELLLAIAAELGFVDGVGSHEYTRLVAEMYEEEAIARTTAISK